MPEPAPVALGFDYGTRKLGVAVGNRLSGTVRPLATLPMRQHTLWPQIDGFVEAWGPAAMVVGLPRQADGQMGQVGRRAEAFAARLGERYHLPVHLLDERLTSWAASRAPDPAGLDAVAASVILADWLGLPS